MALFKELRTILYSNDVDQKELAEIIGRSQSYITARICARKAFTMEDVYATCDHFGIPYEEIHRYFPPKGKEIRREAGQGHVKDRKRPPARRQPQPVANEYGK